MAVAGLVAVLTNQPSEQAVPAAAGPAVVLTNPPSGQVVPAAASPVVEPVVAHVPVSKRSKVMVTVPVAVIEGEERKSKIKEDHV